MDINSSSFNREGYYLKVKKGEVISRFNSSSFKSSKRRERSKYKNIGGYILASTSAFLI